jgi:hypothetical protein
MFLVCLGARVLRPGFKPQMLASAARGPMPANCCGRVRLDSQLLSLVSFQGDGQRTLMRQQPCISRMMAKSSLMARFALSVLRASGAFACMHVFVMRNV